jgi:diamine N-acetyltransferase
MTLSGPNITLRSPQLQDAVYIMEWENDHEISKVSSAEGPYTLEDIRTYIRGIKDVYLDGQLRFMICREEERLGTIDLYDVDMNKSTATVGVLIAESSNRGLGLASEAMDLLKDYAQEYLKIRTIKAYVQYDNKASLRFFERNGFDILEQQDSVQAFSFQLT